MENKFSKKLIRSKSGLRIVSSSENCVSPFLLTEPPWIPDNESKHCNECQRKFDFITRKHHCRRCGQIFCGVCCSRKVALPRMCFVDPVRMCAQCGVTSNTEINFFEKQLKTLLSGATFFLDLPPTPDPDVLQYVTCKLSVDHSRLIIEGLMVEELSPVELSSVRSFGVSRDDSNEDYSEDLEGASSINLLYLTELAGEKRVKLSSAPEPHRRTANSWISALQEAFKLLHQHKAE